MPDLARLRDWRLYAAAIAVLYFFRIAIPLVGYRRVARLYPETKTTPPDAYIRRVAAAVHSAKRLVPGATCLVQACAGRALFALRDYRVIMRVGVRQAGESQIAAHAWLLSGDRIILGSSVNDFDRYRPIADFG